MNLFIRKTILLIIIFNCTDCFCQDEPYKGGFGDGFSIDTFNMEHLDITKGGFSDGYASIVILNSSTLFSHGGFGDGFSIFGIEESISTFTKGGIEDGFGNASYDSMFNSIYVGGDSDGFSYISTPNNFNEVFKGGGSDGFASDKYGHIIFWTGEVGTGWNVSGNWANNIIPSYCNPVVIPSGVPNFPAVNAGLLRVGYYSNEGDYKCERLKINSDAEMTTRVGCFVENYKLVHVTGTLFVKNPTFNAFKNLMGATFQLDKNANVVIKE
jgi:hypothetical protein